MEKLKGRFDVFKPSKVYYSGNNKNYKGSAFAPNCVSGSKWQVIWDPEKYRIVERLLEINTDPGKSNGYEVSKWEQAVKNR